MQASNAIMQIWPIAAYFVILIAMLAAMMLLSYFLGPNTHSRAKNTPYESGIISVKDNHTRFSNHFFLYAIFFVIFDLETIFLFAWVIAFDELGWQGFISASIFILVLLVALIYIWRIGALSLTRRHQGVRDLQQSSQHLVTKTVTKTVSKTVYKTKLSRSH